MAKPCKKCDPHELCEECPEWIFTLADLIMCMMGLFVILWVLKPGFTNPTTASAAASAEAQKQSQDFLETIGEIRAAFGYVPDPSKGDPVDDAMIAKKARLVGPGEQGTKKEHEAAAEGTDPQVQTIREGKLSAVGTRILFDIGRANLDPGDMQVLDQIAKQITGTRFVVIIKGHASRDDFAEGTPGQQFMDVSIRRAQIAADYLTKIGVSPDILRVQGCSTFEPVRQRAYTSDQQHPNRRVEVFSTDVTVRDMQDPRQTSSVPMN